MRRLTQFTLFFAILTPLSIADLMRSPLLQTLLCIEPNNIWLNVISWTSWWSPSFRSQLVWKVGINGQEGSFCPRQQKTRVGIWTLDGSSSSTSEYVRMSNVLHETGWLSTVLQAISLNGVLVLISNQACLLHNSISILMISTIMTSFLAEIFPKLKKLS